MLGHTCFRQTSLTVRPHCIQSGVPHNHFRVCFIVDLVVVVAAVVYIVVDLLIIDRYTYEL